MWCMWLSDLGSGFGKIVKCQTDLQKKCQKGLHNDIEVSCKAPFHGVLRLFSLLGQSPVLHCGVFR